MTWWLVTWTHLGMPYSFTTDDEWLAKRLAVDLPETGRKDVDVVHVEGVPEMEDAAKERVWQAISAAKAEKLSRLTAENMQLHELVGHYRDAAGEDWADIVKGAKP